MFSQYCTFILLSVNESLIIKVKKTNKQKILQYKQILECGPKNCYSSGKKNERYNQKHIFFHPFYERLSLLLTN